MKSITTLLLLISAIPAVAQTETQTRKSRKFDFTYSAALKDVPVGANVKVWLPVAQSNTHQEIAIKNVELPANAIRANTSDKKYGNKIMHIAFEQNSSTPAIEITYSALRREAMADKSKLKLSPAERERFLAANRLVPLSGKPAELISDSKISDESMAAGRQLYDIVGKHMKYDKSQPGYGNGDVLWACDSRTGNCTDFHSLFISLARMNKIPARFEIGFPLPADKSSGQIKGYHCWAWFHTKDQGWVPVDISEADKHPEMREYYFGKLTADRIAFSTGRDIELEPATADGKPLNYFVFPYAEVDGKVWPKEKVELKFSFSGR